MFDIGFSEMIVIAIVALVVIGPERLPRVARTAGLLLGRLQRYVSDVKSDINREIQLDELKRLQAEIEQSAHSVEHSLTSELRAVRQTAQGGTDELQATVAGEIPPPPASNPPLPAADAATAVAAPDQPTRTV